jgi:hypothetical protein
VAGCQPKPRAEVLDRGEADHAGADLGLDGLSERGREARHRPQIHVGEPHQMRPVKPPQAASRLNGADILAPLGLRWVRPRLAGTSPGSSGEGRRATSP